MGRIAAAGAAYFGLVFAAGFALGTIRTLFLLPALGALPAVALEMPIILTICWVAAGWVTRRWPMGAMARLAVGLLAFALLMAAEVGVSLYGLGRSWAGHLAHYHSLAGALGLAGQGAFAVFPLLRRSV